ncbi:Uncharacterized protein dnl_32360 [Desulfonema limicola]|uniref:Uncharacterized protein n=1 Tax=Desulfonema limicola TaxID=45656 RepID=A0A975B8X2_9BACT|nr:Uncharacterized protein dnl_32360 [Desulfonema limicola]
MVRIISGYSGQGYLSWVSFCILGILIQTQPNFQFGTPLVDEYAQSAG